MARGRRIQLIREIQRARKSVVVCYVTSTRANMEVTMAMDAVRRIYDHLAAFPKRPAKPRIDLFLHSNGGEGVVPWRLVTLIREFASEFNVLVPHRAFSAATLAALGANHIVMHPMGMLGPTDPTVTNPFNPADPTNPGRRIGISVEDVTAYIALIKDDVGIRHEDELVQAFNKLADQVHPLALGNVKRSLSQSRMMAKKLLSLHMDVSKDEHRMNEIVDNLTSKLFFHGHPINRIEAVDEVGLLNVQCPPAGVERAMWRLYLDYESEAEMESQFDPPAEFLTDFPTLQPNDQKLTPVKNARVAYVESENSSDVFIIEYELFGNKLPNGATSVTTIFRKKGWVRNPDK